MLLLLLEEHETRMMLLCVQSRGVDRRPLCAVLKAIERKQQKMGLGQGQGRGILQMLVLVLLLLLVLSMLHVRDWETALVVVAAAAVALWLKALLLKRCCCCCWLTEPLSQHRSKP